MSEKLKSIIKKRILILDGGMGTLIQARNLTASDYGSDEYEGCPEMLNITRPDVIADIHEAYLKAGADIIETNSFGGTDIVLAEYGLADRQDELNIAAVKVAKEVALKYFTPDKPRFVAGSMGPTTKSFSVIGGITFDTLENSFYRQAKSLLSAGADIILLETQQDTVNVKAGLIGINRAKEELGLDTPVILSATIESTGTMLAGQTVEALYASVAHFDLFSIGFNCGTGPTHMTDNVRTLSGMSNNYLNLCPNAGMPTSEGGYDLTPEKFVAEVEKFYANGWINISGGCCGTTPAHIALLSQTAGKYKPREVSTKKGFYLSGIDFLEVTEDSRPLIVGERANVIGSRKFKRLIAEEQFEEASEVAVGQVKKGAHVIDICLGNPDRDEVADMKSFMPYIIKRVKVPLMLDSTNPKVIEEGLKWIQGKAVINSINLEDGEKRFEEVLPLVKRHGAAIVVGTIDDDPKEGMAVTRARKIEVAKKSYDLLVNKYNILPEDIIFDPLVFPVGTGDKKYDGSAEETFEGLRLIKETLPEVSTILGVSNVSFGLPLAGREVLNAVYLYHATKAGLDFAIVNSEGLKRYSTISEEEQLLAENLLFFEGEDPLGRFVEFYKDKKVAEVVRDKNLPVEQRLAASVVEGSKDGLIDDLKEMLDSMSAIEIINGPLVKGMAEVGRLFNDNQLIVAEVLQSAEVMKTAADYLKPFMAKGESATKGKMLLATVKGDVHDVGKNLVDIIFSNNGYEVIDLGIKVPSEVIIEAQRREKADVIGLSGLLVKSTLQMAETVSDLDDAGIDVPVIGGGAALTRAFTEQKMQPRYKGKVIYAKDAMDGLAKLDAIFRDKGKGDPAKVVDRVETDSLPSKEAHIACSCVPKLKKKIVDIPSIPFTELRVKDDYDLAEVFSYINPKMFYGKHLGLKGDVAKMVEEGNKKAIELTSAVKEFQQEIIAKGLIKVKSVLRFFPVSSEGETITIYDPADSQNILEEIEFQRQPTGERLSLSDYLATNGDNMAMFAATAGEGVAAMVKEFKDKGDYLKSHIVASLAMESAEAAAELLHKEIRSLWGIAGSDGATPKELFKGNYRGQRYSFGYPACPDISGQEYVFRLLEPEQIGIQLTDGFMMDPEASISAMVFHHPGAKYFSVK
ncbi:MAG: methionine synthase [Nitrospinota bacterium]|nr:methionine synthase [Nitrospinota bacterium]